MRPYSVLALLLVGVWGIVAHQVEEAARTGQVLCDRLPMSEGVKD